MLTALFWIGLMIQTLLTYRILAAGLYAKYPFFSLHVGSSLITTLVLYKLILSNPRAYDAYYWMGQFLTMITACGIVLEVLRNVFSSDPVARKYAPFFRTGLYVLIVCISGIYLWTPRALGGNISNLNLERNFRLIESFFLLAMLAVILHCGLVMGRNLTGMFLGYGLYVAASLLILALRSYAGPALEGAWEVIQPLAYVVCLSIWLYSLWAYYPISPARLSAAGADNRFVSTNMDFSNGAPSGSSKAVRT